MPNKPHPRRAFLLPLAENRLVQKDGVLALSPPKEPPQLTDGVEILWRILYDGEKERSVPSEKRRETWVGEPADGPLHERRAFMANSICGVDCGACPFQTGCGGCVRTNGRPFGGDCVVANCCHGRGYDRCGSCQDRPCGLRAQLAAEFNDLGIADMEPVTDLNALKGAFVNLAYTLPNGQQTKFLEDTKIYLGNQLPKRNSDRCYGLAADETFLLVCEYGAGGADPALVLYKRRNNPNK